MGGSEILSEFNLKITRKTLQSPMPGVAILPRKKSWIIFKIEICGCIQDSKVSLVSMSELLHSFQIHAIAITKLTEYI